MISVSSCCDLRVNIYNDRKLLNSIFIFDVAGLHARDVRQTMGLWRALRHDIEIQQSKHAIAFYLFHISVWMNMGKYVFLANDK